jgi:Cys-tRNA(Pro)/Cys-tRNA(Cys) deacylase
MAKTNAIRILETAGVRRVTHEHDVSDGKIDGVSVAAKCGRLPDMVFKTLVTVGKTTGVNVFVIPVAFELDLKKAAEATGDKYTLQYVTPIFL